MKNKSSQKNKAAKTDKIIGTLSIEHLHHFRCGECNKWWSVGDPSIALPGKTSAMKRKWFCPWCGVVNVYKTSQNA